MGLDYSYLLYFKREQLWEALQGVARFARPSQCQTLVVFPDHILPLALEPWNKEHRMVKFDDPKFEFTISLYFPEDDEITEYALRLFPDYYETMVKESPLGIPIGTIYTTVYSDLSVFMKEFDNSDKKELATADHVLMEFGTTGTKMSLLFSESASIRNRFQELLEANHGVCGILNREGPSEVIWLNGRRLASWIDDPSMPLEEIIACVDRT